MQIVDLSYPIHTDMPLYPVGRPRTYVETFFRQRAIHRVSSTTCILSDHAGTHVDAPLHFKENGASIDQLPLSWFTGRGITFDVRSRNPGQNVLPGDVEKACLENNIEVRPYDIVLFNTGTSKLWGSSEYYERVIGIAAETVRWLYMKGVRVYGVDAVTVDVDQKNYPAHVLLREFDHCIIENLANLDKLSQPTFRFIGLPLPIRGGSASPIRAVAIFE